MPPIVGNDSSVSHSNSSHLINLKHHLSLLFKRDPWQSMQSLVIKNSAHSEYILSPPPPLHKGWGDNFYTIKGELLTKQVKKITVDS